MNVELEKITEDVGEIKVKAVKVKNYGTNEMIMDICAEVNIRKEYDYKILFQVKTSRRLGISASFISMEVQVLTVRNILKISSVVKKYCIVNENEEVVSSEQSTAYY